jgi:hypothetical protein
MEGVVRAPSEFSITLVTPPSMMQTQELVVPKSMPITFPISISVYSVMSFNVLDIGLKAFVSSQKFKFIE